MRIAVSGSHRTGKSTLAGELALRRPGHDLVAEPYWLLVEEGYLFAQPPSLEDFEAQLERSLELLEEDRADIVFDRCPLDCIAYLEVHPDAGAFDLGEWLPRVQRAMRTLDLVVFVPIEDLDRINPDPAELEGVSREEVDEALKRLLLEDPLGLGLEVLEVAGPVEARVEAVEARLRG